MKQTPDQVAERAAELFQQGFCCAESVLQAIAESLDIRSEIIPRIATGLCGGVARTGDICGAVSGGVLAISLATGRNHPTEPREDNQRLARMFLDECEQQFGSTHCEKLMGCRLDTPEGMKFFKENKLREKCAFLTREAARIATRLVKEHECAKTGTQ
ncbi:MAG: C-GCAxxG-C-C family protein [Verrucomicrobiia bacterium]